MGRKINEDGGDRILKEQFTTIIVSLIENRIYENKEDLVKYTSRVWPNVVRSSYYLFTIAHHALYLWMYACDVCSINEVEYCKNTNASAETALDISESQINYDRTTL